MDKAFTVRQVAELLSVNQRTVYRLIDQKALPFFKVSGSWRLLEADLQQWVTDQKRIAGCAQGDNGEA